MTNDSIFLQISEAGDRLGICSGRVYQLISAGLLPGIKRGRRTLIPRQAFETYIQQVNQEALNNLNSRDKETEAAH